MRDALKRLTRFQKVRMLCERFEAIKRWQHADIARDLEFVQRLIDRINLEGSLAEISDEELKRLQEIVDG